MNTVKIKKELLLDPSSNVDLKVGIKILNNMIRFFYIRQGPPLWSSGQSSWLQIQRSRFESQRYQILCEVVGLERGPLSRVSTTEELLGRKSSGSSLENRDYGLKGSVTLTT
jgi:hypothetical protein